jgi:hypothetical protein
MDVRPLLPTLAFWRRVLAARRLREVIAPERLVYTFAWADAEGKPHYETVVTVTFAEHEDKTELTLHQSIFKSAAARDEHQGDWSKELQRFAEYLANPCVTAIGERDGKSNAHHYRSQRRTGELDYVLRTDCANDIQGAGGG